MSLPIEKPSATTSRRAPVAAIVTLAVAATALWVRSRAKQAEAEHPPRGRLLDIDGVLLHYLERGDANAAAPTVVLLHGNAVSLEDFQASGVIDDLARDHRVIAFDRPGFGHSSRPRDRVWTPTAQAELLQQALQHLGVRRAVIVAHSLANTIAIALALDHPESVSSLVLLGGYHYPEPRADSALLAPLAVPVVGDALRYTVGALSSRALIGATVKTMFSPRKVPADFFPTVSREMMLRPSQTGAAVADGLLMVPAAEQNAARYQELRMPVTIIAGAMDKIVDPEAHSVRLHEDIAQSELIVQPSAGHMVHYVAGPQIRAAIERAAGGSAAGGG